MQRETADTTREKTCRHGIFDCWTCYHQLTGGSYQMFLETLKHSVRLIVKDSQMRGFRALTKNEQGPRYPIPDTD